MPTKTMNAEKPKADGLKDKQALHYLTTLNKQIIYDNNITRGGKTAH